MATSSDQTVPSSPRLKSEITFSDALTRCSTPPSSPPGFPWEQEEDEGEEDAPCQKPAPPIKPTTINAFSVLGKRRILEETTPNPRPRKQIALPTKQNAIPQPSQMQLSLGQETRTKCPACGMEYVKSSGEDRKLHQKYHAQNLAGYDVGDTFVASTLPHRRMPGLRSGDAIIEVEASDAHHRKRRAHAALEIVQRELGAVEIPHDDIWKPNSNPSSSELEPRYRAYMYIRDRKCIGYLLIERLSHAFAVIDPTASTSSSTSPSPFTTTSSKKKPSALAALRARKAQQAPITTTTTTQQHPLHLSPTASHPARLGVSRIWTSSAHRGQKIAPALLDAAVEFHNSSSCRVVVVARAERGAGEEILPPQKGNGAARREQVLRREQVAFSQPTEAGARLARRWIGRAYGWLVYV